MTEWINARGRTPEPGKTVLCYYQYEISGMKRLHDEYPSVYEGV